MSMEKSNLWNLPLSPTNPSLMPEAREAVSSNHCSPGFNVEAAESDPFEFDMGDLFDLAPSEIMQSGHADAPGLQALTATGAPSTKTDSKPPIKRSLTAYNLFFKFQRKQILAVMPVRASGKPKKSHGKMGFADMARAIAGKWKTCHPQEKAIFVELAAADKKRYKQEMEEWKKVNKTSKTYIIDPHACTSIPMNIAAPVPVGYHDGGASQAPNHLVPMLQSLGVEKIEDPKESPAALFSTRMVPSCSSQNPFMGPMGASLVSLQSINLLEYSYKSFLSRARLGPHAPTTVRSIVSPNDHGFSGSNIAVHQDDDQGIASLAAKLGSDGCDLLLEIFNNHNSNGC